MRDDTKNKTSEDDSDLVICARTGHNVHHLLSAAAYPGYDKGYRWLGVLLCLAFGGVAVHAAVIYPTVTHAGWLYGLYALLCAPTLLAHRWLCQQNGTSKRYRLGALLIGAWPLCLWSMLPTLLALLAVAAPHTLAEVWTTWLYIGVICQSALVWARSKLVIVAVMVLVVVFVE